MTAKKNAMNADGKEAQGTHALSFEQSLEKLEAMVAEMERGAIGLEKMMEHFEEGQKLIAICSARLNEVERKIEILVRKDNKVIAEPFDETGTDEPDPEPEKGADEKPDELF